MKHVRFFKIWLRQAKLFHIVLPLRLCSGPLCVAQLCVAHYWTWCLQVELNHYPGLRSPLFYPFELWRRAGSVAKQLAIRQWILLNSIDETCELSYSAAILYAK